MLVSIWSSRSRTVCLSSNSARRLKVSGGTEREILHLNAGQVGVLCEEAEKLRPGSGVLVLILAYGGLGWG